MDKNKFVEKGLTIEESVDLYPFLTMKVHAKAKYFTKVSSRQQLIEAILLAKKMNFPYVILGGGSKIVPSSSEILKLIVLNKYEKLEVLKEENNQVEILVSSGYPTSLFVFEMINQGLAGVEYFWGLPGTVGGAIYTNAKWTKPLSYFTDCLKYAYLVEKNGTVKKVDSSYFKFSYDFSFIQKTQEVILEAVFVLKKEKVSLLKEKANFALEYRKKTQPIGKFSAGCFFKNIEGVSAGYLIDQCGLKGLTYGGFTISQKHGNFIINENEGKVEDLWRLAAKIKEKVYQRFKITLEEEVIKI